jgi:hypothetical protein
MVQLLQKLYGMPYFQAAQIAGLFGIDEHTFQMLEAGLPQMQKFIALREKMFRAAGINPSDMAARSHEFMVHFRILETGLENLAEIIAFRLMPAGEKLMDWLTRVVDWFTKADKVTGGWSSKLLGVVGALTGVSIVGGKLGLGAIARGGAGLVGRLFGGAAAAEGAGALAGEGAAAAAGGGLLATVGIPVAVMAALGALIWLIGHPDELKEQVDQAHKFGDFLRGALTDAWQWTKDKLKGQVDQVHETGDGLKVQAQKFGSGLMGDLARTVGKFEGFRDKVYRDVAGNATFGFGHKLKPGENVEGQNPIALFMQDLQSSLWAVARSVKVRLRG